jgi:hypothetical protein
VITAVAAVYNHALYIDEMREAIRAYPDAVESERFTLSWH